MMIWGFFIGMILVRWLFYMDGFVNIREQWNRDNTVFILLFLVVVICIVNKLITFGALILKAFRVLIPCE